MDDLIHPPTSSLLRVTKRGRICKISSSGWGGSCQCKELKMRLLDNHVRKEAPAESPLKQKQNRCVWQVGKWQQKNEALNLQIYEKLVSLRGFPQTLLKKEKYLLESKCYCITKCLGKWLMTLTWRLETLSINVFLSIIYSTNMEDRNTNRQFRDSEKKGKERKKLERKLICIK